MTAISRPSSLVKLNFSSLDSNNDLPKFTTFLSTPLTLLVILALFLMNTCLSEQISSLPKSCYSHVHDIRCNRPFLAFKTASTSATSLSKVDYCNSLNYSLSNCHLDRLQLIQNSLARAAAVIVLKSTHLSCSQHWFKVYEYIKHKFLSLTYKVRTTIQPLSLIHI